MSRKKAGWVPIPGDQMVSLLTPIYVKRWGYEVSRETVLQKLLEEAYKAVPGASAPIFVGVGDHPHLTIAQRHPMFKKYWESMPQSFDKILETLDFEEKGGKIDLRVLNYNVNSLLHDIHWKVVEHFVQAVVDEQRRKTQARKLFTASFEETHDKKVVAAGTWRGPWIVRFRRIVKTGTYHPCSGGGPDWEPDPPHLSHEKTHVLYWLDYAPRYKDNFDDKYKGLETVYVEKSNTVDWACEKSARVLMGEPVLPLAERAARGI